MESKPNFRYPTNLNVEETGLGQETAIEGKLVSASLKNETNINQRMKDPGPQWRNHKGFAKNSGKVNMIEGIRSSTGKHWRLELSGFCTSNFQSFAMRYRLTCNRIVLHHISYTCFPASEARQGGHSLTHRCQ